MDELDVAVLNLLIFPETFSSIVEECPLLTTRPILGDVLKKLMHDELVVPMRADEDGHFKRSLGYDSDHLEQYRFQISGKGLSALNRSTSDK